MTQPTIDSELRTILEAHAARYPRMEPQDAVKLIFQNEFGGGHLIADPEQSLRRLRAEAESVPPTGRTVYEDIGNGVVRVMLGGDYPLEQLNRDFVRSAAAHPGDRTAFLRKLETLRAVTAAGEMTFSPDALEAYLSDYLAAGCPVVSHSEAYRAAYAPAYRIVLRRFSLPLLLREAEQLLKERGRVLLAVDGRCGSGKSTFAASLHDRFGWSVIHMDDFFLRPEQRTPERYATPGENVDHERFLEEVLLPLEAGTLTSYRPFDCETFLLAEPVSYTPSSVTVIEGSYACHPALRKHYDLRVFLTLEPEEQLRRIAARNPDKLDDFKERWIPLEERYFSGCGVEDACEYSLELM